MRHWSPCRFLLIPMLAVLLALLAGCDGDSPTASNPGGAPPTTRPATRPASTRPAGAAPDLILTRQVRVGLLLPSTNHDYFKAAGQGATIMSRRLSTVELKTGGPATFDDAAAAKVLGDWVAAGDLDVLAVAPDDPQAVAGALRTARDAGMRVVTFQTDAASADQRTMHVAPADGAKIAERLVDDLALQTAADGKVAIVQSSRGSTQDHAWSQHVRERLKRYPRLELVAHLAAGPDAADAQKAVAELMAKMEAEKEKQFLRGVIVVSPLATPGVAEAVRVTKRQGRVTVVGVGTPRALHPYVADGTVLTAVVWDPSDLGSLTVQVAEALAVGRLVPGDKFFASSAGVARQRDEGSPMQGHAVRDGVVYLGDVVVMKKDNLGKFRIE